MTDQLDYTLPGGQQVQFTPYRIGGRNGAAATVIGSGSLESENFVAGSAGWRILGDGSVEFSDGTFRGALEAASGTFSGDLDAAGGTFAGDISAASGTFTGTLEGGEIHIGGFDNTSFHVDADGDMWMGAATAGAAPFSVSRFGGITATDIFLYDPYITTPVVSQGTFDGIDVDGSATIITGGQLASDNYIAGTSGWAIDGDGDAEFNDITARGELITGPDSAGITQASIVPYGGGGPYQGTKWGGPDPIGTGVQGGITQYTDAATAGINWAAYTEIRQDILTIEARSYMEIVGDIDLYGDIFNGNPTPMGIFSSPGVEIDGDLTIEPAGTGSYLTIEESVIGTNRIALQFTAPAWHVEMNGTRTTYHDPNNTLEYTNDGSTEIGRWNRSTGYLELARVPNASFNFYTNWQDFAGSWIGAGWYEEPGGTIHLEGLIRRINSTSPTTDPIMLLPAGARPPASRMFNCLTSTGAIARVDVGSNGQVNMVGGPAIPVNGWITVSPISFQKA